MALRHPITGPRDHRFDAARASNQSRGRGWDFSPSRPSRYPVNLIRASAVLLVGCLVLGGLWLL